MATTSPDSIYYPTASDQIAPLETAFATLASSVQGALTNSRAIKSYRWANNAARTAQTGMAKNDRGYQSDTDALYTYNGTTWVVDDTGWLALPSQSGNFTFDNNAAYRRMGKVVYLRGQISKKTGNIANGDAFFTMPAGLRPANYFYTLQSGVAGAFYRFRLAPTGLADINGLGGSSGGYVMLDNIAYIADA